MLFAIDKALRGVPSKVINFVTGGPKHSSMCARVYLHTTYAPNPNKFVVLLRHIIDTLEPGHCKFAAYMWYRKHKQLHFDWPPQYQEFLTVWRLK